jgi:hypothetical protein
MSSRLHLAVTTFALTLMFSLNPVIAKSQHKPVTAEQTQIIDTVNTIFSAASAEDIAKFDSVIAPDFYIFANGTRFNGDAIMGAIKAQHAAGKRYDEHVTEPDIQINQCTFGQSFGWRLGCQQIAEALSWASTRQASP